MSNSSKRKAEARTEAYVDLRGRQVSLESLDPDERRLIAALRRRAATNPAWHEFTNHFVKAVGQFYEGRGLSRRKTTETAAWRIAADLSGRLGIAQGIMRAPDYRDELAHLIRTRFKTRRDFCKATGLSEGMLSHVLSGRKHLAVETLMKALDRLGLELRVVPKPVISANQVRKRVAS